MSAEKFGFTDSQWEVLKAGPIHMLKQVAGADSLVDRAEWTSLVQAVLGSAQHADELVRAVMEDLSDELEREHQLSEHDGFHAVDGLRAVALLLDGLPDKGKRFRETLLELGATIADASGAQLTRVFGANAGSANWVRSAGTSATEREALKAASEALGLG